MIKPENTVLFERSYDLNYYWMTMDSLHNVDYDMFFSPFKKYTCQAGCKVCYISKQLDDSAAVMDQYAPLEITPAMEHSWHFWFDHFQEIGYNDDVFYIKSKFPKVYDWLKQNAYRFNYCMTDNAILRQRDILLNELDFKSIMDIAISDSFLETNPGMWNKIAEILGELKNKYAIGQIKFIITQPGPQNNAIAQLIEWVDKEELVYLVHHDFTDESNLKHQVPKAFNYNDWVMCQENRLFEIQKETIHLFNDRWFFSTQDATSRDPFWIMSKGDDNAEELLYKIIEGKQTNYALMDTAIKPTGVLAKKFKKYFTVPNTYKLNRNYNFIPHLLLSKNSVFVKKLTQQGWINTEQGLYKPAETLISIIEPIKNLKEQ
jgi:hypothetical protein